MSEIKPYKAIVWDLDHTLWHGILIESDDLVLRANMENILKTLDERGILLSIASKNNATDAMAKLKSLSLDHYFLYPEIHWGPKSESMQRIKENLNIGMDAIAFIDDQPFEREEVQHSCPEAAIFDVDIIETLLENPLFHPRFITDESASRRQMYLDDMKRQEEEEHFEATNIEFLASQKMEFTIAVATEADLQRMEELVARTNQLNATGYTYGYDELEGFLHSSDHVLFVAELKDKHGHYGKIGTAMIAKEDDRWTLKLLLMSCRVMSRGVGNILLNYIINYARKHEKTLYTEFLSTDRNRLMYMTVKFAGFVEDGKLPDGRTLLRHNTDKDAPYPNYLQLNLPKETKKAADL